MAAILARTAAVTRSATASLIDFLESKTSDHALAEAISRDAFRRDPDRFISVVAELIERLKAERGYSWTQ
jgi:hypothetical protein